jgi:hypothetical protein
MVRSVLAVIAGYATMVIFTLCLFAVIQFVWPDAFPTPEAFPSTMIAVIIIVFGLLSAVVGGFICAVIARTEPLKHGIALSALVLVMSIISALTSPIEQPIWYTAGLTVAGCIGALFGAKMRQCGVGGTTKV